MVAILKVLSCLQGKKFEQDVYEDAYVHFTRWVVTKARAKSSFLENLSRRAGPMAFEECVGRTPKSCEAGVRRAFVLSDDER